MNRHEEELRSSLTARSRALGGRVLEEAARVHAVRLARARSLLRVLQLLLRRRRGAPALAERRLLRAVIGETRGLSSHDCHDSCMADVCNMVRTRQQMKNEKYVNEHNSKTGFIANPDMMTYSALGSSTSRRIAVFAPGFPRATPSLLSLSRRAQCSAPPPARLRGSRSAASPVSSTHTNRAKPKR